MTIGIDARLYSPTYTGIGRYVAEFIKHAAQLDTESRFVVFLNPKEFKTFETPNERWSKVMVDVAHYSFAEQWSFLRILKKQKLDMMYFPHFNAPIFYRKPFVVTIHDLTLHYYPSKSYFPKWSLKKTLQSLVYKVIMGRIIANSHEVIAISNNTKRDIIKEYGANKSKILTVYEGVPDEFKRPSADTVTAAAQRFGISKPYLMYSGVWRSHKNLLRLLDAFARLRKRGHDVQLVMTGKKDKAYPEIPQQIMDLSIADEVILTGFVSDEDLVSLICGAEAYVFPSLYEGFGLPPLEAMKLGVPVACSNRASLPEVCGDAASFFNPEDVEQMTEAIRKILDDKTFAKVLVQKGHENLKRFSWNDMSKQILNSLRKKEIHQS